MAASTPVYKEDWPFKDVRASTVVWRYQSLEKFADMLESSALYFCRPDQFGDKLEGVLSPEGIHGTSATDRAFEGSYKIKPEEYQNTVAANEAIRRSLFVNCWNMKGGEDIRMWKGYTKTSDSVVVRSTARALKQCLPLAVRMAGVTYIEKTFPRTRLGHTSLFFYKDKKSFEYESELRLIAYRSPGETIQWDNPDDFGRKVPIDLAHIHEVVCHPSMPETRKEEVAALAHKYCPAVTVKGSRIPPW